jgi:hypothetical protein
MLRYTIEIVKKKKLRRREVEAKFMIRESRIEMLRTLHVITRDRNFQTLMHKTRHISITSMRKRVRHSKFMKLFDNKQTHTKSSVQQCSKF